MTFNKLFETTLVFSIYFVLQLGSLEGQNAILHNGKVDLSPQELVDCSYGYGNYGCEGGWTHKAYKYIQHKCISALKNYKYEAVQGECKASTTPRENLTVTGYTVIDPEEEALRQAVGKQNHT